MLNWVKRFYNLLLCNRYSLKAGALIGGLTGALLAICWFLSVLMDFQRAIMLITALAPTVGAAFGGIAVIMYAKNIPAAISYIAGTTLAVVISSTLAKALQQFSGSYSDMIMMIGIIILISVNLIVMAAKSVYIFCFLLKKNLSQIYWLYGFVISLAVSTSIVFTTLRMAGRILANYPTEV